QNIKGYADLINQETTTEAERTKYTHIITSETERLSALTKQLLLLTSLDALKEPMKREAFRLDQQIKDVIQKYRWLMEEKNIVLSLETEEVNFTGQKEYTEKIWENILSNAVKYTPEGGMIDVILNANDTEVTVIFSATGIGI